MKLFILLIFALTGTSFALDGEIAAAARAIQNNDTASLNQSLINLNSAILRFEPVDSPINKASPRRIEARRIIADKLQPVKRSLIQLTTSPNQTVAGTATVILGHIPNDDEVKKALLLNLSKTSSAPLATSSLSSLFLAGMADASVREIAAKRMAEFDPRDNSGQSVALALLQYARYDPIPEGFETYLRILRDDKPVSDRMLAVNALMELGPRARAALPEIEKLLQQLEEQGGDFRDIDTVKQAISLIRGRGDAAQTAVSPAATAAQTASPSPTATPVNH